MRLQRNSLVANPDQRRATRCGVMLFIALLAAANGNPVEPPDRIGPAGKIAHEMITHLADDCGGRFVGSPGSRAARAQLVDALRQLGLKPEVVPFTMPGWERGEDRVELVVPFARPLRAVSFAYSPAVPAFAATVVDLGLGRAEQYPAQDVRGRIGLMRSGGGPLRETVRAARERGLRALLVINREGDGRLLARTGSFIGEPLPFPVFSVTQEEGHWLERLLGRGREVKVRLETRSHCRPVEAANVVARLPGESADRVIVGAHFDSWDLGQGAMDNGLGVAQLYALAHALRGERLRRTVELVWFDAEELGLWGSREAVRRLGDAPVVAMVNLDMVGVPQAVNALGCDALVPWLERWNEARGEQRLPQGVLNRNWFGSDHLPYQLSGVRTLTFHGPIDPSAVNAYHDFGDTIDKVPEALVHDSATVIADLVVALANDRGLPPGRREERDVRAALKRDDVDDRMRGVGWWPFSTP